MTPRSLLFGRVVDLVVGLELHLRVRRGQHLRDRRRQRRLAVVHVTDRPDVHVRLGPVEFLLGHLSPPLLALKARYFSTLPITRATTSSLTLRGASSYFSKCIE